MKEQIINVATIEFKEDSALKPTFQFKQINNTLENLQDIVGGWIDIPFISRDFAQKGIDMIINDEGKIFDLKSSVVFVDREDNKILDVVKGNVIFSSHDEEGNTTSLNKEQENFLKEAVFNNISIIVSGEEKSVVFAIYI